MAKAKKTKTLKKEKAPPTAEKSRPAKFNSNRPMWSGYISFGLVNIPIKVVAAIRDKGIHFHQLHEKDDSRVQYKIYCAKEGVEVPKEEIVKGYEVAKGQYVVVGDDELEALAPKATRGLEIINFVKAEEVDPLFYDRGYYLVPDKNAEKAYVVLMEAMKQAKMVGLAKVVMRKREYLAIVRPEGNVLSLETMHFADEVVRPQDAGFTPNIKPSEAEMKMAAQLIESMAGAFDPEKVKDDYRNAVLELANKKVQGKEVVQDEKTQEEGPQVIDLMAALKKSLERTNAKRAA